MKIILLPQTEYHALQDIVLSVYPHEACGLILGYHTKTNKITITRVIQVTNVHEHPEKAYLLDPNEMAKHFLQAEQENTEVIGVFHSHPNQSTLPSPTDKKQAWPGLVYMILAKKHDRIEAQAWEMNPQTHEFEELKITITP